MNEVWIVEMWNDAYKRPARRGWEPTVGCALARRDARRELAEWKENNPTDKFRLRKYAVIS
jgi:hypothetical protein